MIDHIHEGLVVGAGAEKDPYYASGRLLLKRESGRIQVIVLELGALVELRDQLNEVIPQIQDELAAEFEAESRDLELAEQRAIEQRETELEIQYDRDHPYDP